MFLFRFSYASPIESRAWLANDSSVYTKMIKALSLLPDLLLFSLPILCTVASAVVFLLLKKRRGYAYAQSLLLALCSLLFLSAYPVAQALFAVAFVCFLSLLPLPLFSLPQRKREKKKRIRSVDDLTRDILEEKSASVPTRGESVKKILVEGDMAKGEEVYRLSEENISLSHVLNVALKLKKARLSVADRLEADQIYKTLCLYRAKNALTADEMTSLNAYLSTLLKLTAKYSL